MILFKLIPILVGVAGGFLARYVVTVLLPGLVSGRLNKGNTEDPRFIRLVKLILAPNLGMKMAAVAAIPAVIALIAFPMKVVSLPVIGYAAGLVNWPLLIKLKFDIGIYLAMEANRPRKAAVAALLRRGDRSAENLLDQLLRNLPANERSVVYGALVEADGPNIGKYLKQAVIFAEDPLVKVAAFHALREKDKDSFLDELPTFTRNPHRAVRMLAVDHLDLLGRQQARQLIRERQKDEDLEVRNKAQAEWEQFDANRTLEWLAILQGRVQAQPYARQIRELRKELTSGSWQSINATRVALGEAENWEETEPLLRMMEADPNQSALVAVVRRLAQLDTRDAAIAAKNLFLEEEVHLEKNELEQATIEALGAMESLTPRMIGESLNKGFLKEQLAMMQVLPYKKQELALTFLKKMITDTRSHLRVAAIENMAKLEITEEIKGYILGRTNDEDAAVRRATYAVLAEVGDLEILTLLMRKFQAIGEVSGAYNTTNMRYMEKNALEDAIKQLMLKVPLYTAPLHEIMCTRHFTRAVSKKEASFEYPVCRRCRKLTHLIHDVRSIHGVIGPVTEGFSKPGHYEISLWNQVQKKPIFADINVLEIRGGADLDYDWAITAVLGELRNDENMLDKVIPVEIHGNPELHPNSMRLLTEITGDKFPLIRD